MLFSIISLTFSRKPVSLPFYLLFLIEALLVTVWNAETSGTEDVCDLQAAENAFDLPPTGTLQMREHRSKLLRCTPGT